MEFFSTEEYVGLDDNKYIGDLLAEFKAAKDRSKGEILHFKLTFKKKLFRESDEAVADPMFIQLSYVQVGMFYLGHITSWILKLQVLCLIDSLTLKMLLNFHFCA